MSRIAASGRITPRNFTYSLDLANDVQCVTIPNSAGLTYGTSSMSFAFWYCPDFGYRSGTNVMIQTDANTYAGGVMINHFGYDIYVHVKFGGPAFTIPNFFATEKPGAWMRVVVTISNVDRKVRIYRDGVLMGTSSAITAWDITSTNPARIGRSFDLAATARGKYADVVFMKGDVPTDTDIIDDFYFGKSLPNIVHRYALNEGSGVTTVDSIAGNNGTIANGAVYSTEVPMKTRISAVNRILLPTTQNLLAISEPRVLGSDLYAKMNVTVTPSVWPQIDANYAINFGDNTLTRYAYQSFVIPDPRVQYTFSTYIMMDDGGAPIAISNSAPTDFQLVFSNNAVAVLAPENIIGSLYRLSYTGYGTSAGILYGLVKFTLQTPRSFKAVGYHLSRSPGPLPYKKTYGAAYDIGTLRVTP